MGHDTGGSACCGWILDSRVERNRPEELKAEEAPDLELVNTMRASLSGGTPPSEIAERVFESIESEDFYILPHPEWDDLVRQRVEAIIARREVASFDWK